MAEKQKDQINPLDLDYGTNMVMPEVPQKQAVAIRTHMNSIREAIARLDFDTDMNRNKEVVSVTIPCSELFAPNDTVLKPTATVRLQHFAKILQYPTMYKFVIAVYSDDTGEPEYCEALTSSRANAVEKAMSDIANEYDVPNANIVPYGMGQADQLVENNSIANRDRNRRVVINIVPEWQMIETARAGRLR